MGSAELDGAAADDQRAAQREREARELLLAAGADQLERRPWQPKPVPPSAVDLVQFFLWQSSTAAFGGEDPGHGRAREEDRTRSDQRDRRSAEPQSAEPQSAEARDAEAPMRDAFSRRHAQHRAAAQRAEAQSAEVQSAEGAVAALGLVRAARAEVDQLETGLLFAARGLGLTWAQMATALGLNSPQACQQRLDRLLARGEQPQRGEADR
jgi:hypothetical protein